MRSYTLRAHHDVELPVFIVLQSTPSVEDSIGNAEAAAALAGSDLNDGQIQQVPDSTDSGGGVNPAIEGDLRQVTVPADDETSG